MWLSFESSPFWAQACQREQWGGRSCLSALCYFTVHLLLLPGRPFFLVCHQDQRRGGGTKVREEDRDHLPGYFVLSGLVRDKTVQRSEHPSMLTLTLFINLLAIFHSFKPGKGVRRQKRLFFICTVNPVCREVSLTLLLLITSVPMPLWKPGQVSL